MLREKEICNAIRTAYLYLFPDKKERKKALSRLNLEVMAQAVRYRGENVLAYQTCGNHECSLNYYGPELFSQRGCRIYEKTVQSYSTQVDAACIREVWFLEDGRFVEVSGVTTKYHSAYERFSTCYRTVHHIGGALRELEAAGYIVRHQLRDRQGRISDTEYVIYEQPQPKNPDTPQPDTASPDTGNPDMENPD